MAKLNDIQLLLLTTAATRLDGNLLPPPEQLADLAAKVRRAIASLIKQDLVCETGGAVGDSVWRKVGNERFGATITDAGRAAVGATVPPVDGPDAVWEPASLPTSGGKKIDTVLALLRRGEGATLAEMVAATGWLPHTTRAALTGLRKKGHALDKRKRGEATCYHVSVAA